jgi:hypothetical protein
VGWTTVLVGTRTRDDGSLIECDEADFIVSRIHDIEQVYAELTVFWIILFLQFFFFDFQKLSNNLIMSYHPQPSQTTQALPSLFSSPSVSNQTSSFTLLCRADMNDTLPLALVSYDLMLY